MTINTLNELFEDGVIDSVTYMEYFWKLEKESK